MSSEPRNAPRDSERPTDDVNCAEDQQNSGPKRNKRKKYAARACDKCRNRKLRCSGDAPCARCVKFKHHCSLLEDEPAPPSDDEDVGPRSYVPGPHPGAQRGQVKPRHLETSGAAASDHHDAESSVMAQQLLSHLANLERETAMIRQAVAGLANVELPPSGKDDDGYAGGRSFAERGWSPGPSSVASPEQDIYSGDISVTQGFSHLEASLAKTLHQAGVSVSPSPVPDSFASESPYGLRKASDRATQQSQSGDAQSKYLRLWCGGVEYRLPTVERHEEYLSFYFAQINPFHPCLNEADTRKRCRAIFEHATARPDLALKQTGVPQTLAPFLAMLFSLYSVVDVVGPGANITNTRPSKPIGYVWWRQAQELVGRRMISSASSDPCGVQILILETLCFAHNGRLSAAYATIGSAGRLVFQHGLNFSSRWSTRSPYHAHIFHRVAWTTFFMDRRISLTCGRPYGMRSEDMALSQPAALVDSDVSPDAPLPGPTNLSTLQPYVGGYVTLAQLYGQAWDTVASPNISADDRPAAVEKLDAQIVDCITEFARETRSVPHFMGISATATTRQHQRLVIRTLLLELRILLRFSQIISLTYDERCGAICVENASRIVEAVHQASVDASWDDAYYLKSHAPTILFTPLIVLSTVLIRRQSSSNYDYELCKMRFKQAVAITQRLGSESLVGAAMAGRLEGIIRLTSASLSSHKPGSNTARDAAPNSAESDQALANAMFLNGIDLSDVNQLLSSELANMAAHGQSGLMGGAEAPDIFMGTSEWWDAAAGLGSSEAAGPSFHQELEEFPWDSFMGLG